MTWLLVATILGALAVGGHLVAGAWPLKQRLLFATALLVTAPTVLAQGLWGTAWLFEQLSPISGPPAWLIMLLPGALTVGALWLLREVDFQALGRLPIGLLLAALALFAVVNAPLLATGVATGQPSKATATWSVEVQAPQDERYELRMPFLTPQAGDIEASWLQEALGTRLQVLDGQARVSVVDGEARIVGQGPLTLVTHHAYYGSVAHREAFTGLSVTDVPLRLAANTNASIPLKAEYAFSGGQGHTCWAEGILTGTARTWTDTELTGPDLAVVCA